MASWAVLGLSKWRLVDSLHNYIGIPAPNQHKCMLVYLAGYLIREKLILDLQVRRTLIRKDVVEGANDLRWVGVEGVQEQGLSLSSSQCFSSCFTHFIALKEFNMFQEWELREANAWLGKMVGTLPRNNNFVEIGGTLGCMKNKRGIGTWGVERSEHQQSEIFIITSYHCVHLFFINVFCCLL